MAVNLPASFRHFKTEMLYKMLFTVEFKIYDFSADYAGIIVHSRNFGQVDTVRGTAVAVFDISAAMVTKIILDSSEASVSAIAIILVKRYYFTANVTPFGIETPYKSVNKPFFAFLLLKYEFAFI